MNRTGMVRKQKGSSQGTTSDDWARTHAPRVTPPPAHALAPNPKQPATHVPEHGEPPKVAQASRELESQIRARAHEIYLERVKCGREGSAMSDWLVAERELNGRPNTGAAVKS